MRYRKPIKPYRGRPRIEARSFLRTYSRTYVQSTTVSCPIPARSSPISPCILSHLNVNTRRRPRSFWTRTRYQAQRACTVSAYRQKIIEPVKCVILDYDGYIHIPKEGDLVLHGPPCLSCLLFLPLFLWPTHWWNPDKVKPWICQLKFSVRTHSGMLPLVPVYARNGFLY